jgi:ERCC4-type nuclease
MRFTVVIDTREQKPWSLPQEYCDSVRGTLKTGDYAILGDNDFAIERKSLNDFVGTITRGWERFIREIGRMDRFSVKVVVVEANFRDFCFWEQDGELQSPKYNAPKVTPQFLMSRMAELIMDYEMNIIFGGDALLSSVIAVRLLQKRYIELLNEGKV